jgi:hypothetical protein
VVVEMASDPDTVSESCAEADGPAPASDDCTAGGASLAASSPPPTMDTVTRPVGVLEVANVGVPKETVTIRDAADEGGPACATLRLASPTWRPPGTEEGVVSAVEAVDATSEGIEADKLLGGAAPCAAAFIAR